MIAMDKTAPATTPRHIPLMAWSGFIASHKLIERLPAGILIGLALARFLAGADFDRIHGMDLPDRNALGATTAGRVAGLMAAIEK